ncbi:hypothetical protein B9Z55_016105 [Caenorhabditis nigoni]|uniref:Uncharacterized protein n=1 Tax=Caenorhabditis nigoni TaxID=1611254 RepID=A0A2G5UDR4_9PELO|nr:hypothetical protein B9Z55_016105 [Caenorhabditis nigoni]
MIRLKTENDNFLSYSEPVDCHSETEVPSTTFRNSEIPPSQSSDGQKRVSDNMIRIKTENDNFLSYSEPVDCHSETEVPSTTFRNSEIPPSQSSDGQKRVSDNMIRLKTENDNFLSYSEPVDCHSETGVPSTTFRNSEIPPSQSSDGQKRVSDNMIRLKTENDNFLSYSEPVDCHSETEVPSTTFRNSEIPPSQSSDGQKRVSDNMIRLKTENDNFLSYSEPVDCHSETEVPSTTFRNSVIPPSQSSDGQKRVSDNMIRIKTEIDNFLSYSEPVDCHSETEVSSTMFRNSEIPPSQSSDGQKRVSDNMIRIKTENDNFLSYSEPVDCHSETEVPSTTFRNSVIPPSQSSDGQKRVSDNMIRIKTEIDNFLSYSEPVDCHSETEVPSTTFRNSEIPPSQSSDGQKRVSDNMIRIKTDNDNFLSYSEPVDCHSETEVPSTTFRNSEIPPSQSSDGQKRVSDNMIRIKTDNDNFLSYSEPVDCHSETEVPSTTFRNSEIPPSQSSDGQKRVSDNMIRIKTDNDNFLSYSEPVDCHSETEVPSTTFRNSEIPPSQSSDGQKRVSDNMIKLKTELVISVQDKSEHISY